MIRKGFVQQPDMELLDAVDRAGEFGVDFLEILMDGDNHRDTLERNSEEVLERAEKAEISLMAHLPFSFSIGSPHEHVRHGTIEELRSCIETAAAVGVEKVVLHASSSAWSTVWEEDEIHGFILDSVEEIDGAAVDHGVEVCFENVPGGSFTTQDFDALFERTDAAMTLDTGHAIRDGMEEEDIAEFVRENKDRISHVHVNDVMGEDTDHVPFGAGRVDFDPIMDAFHESGWSGTLSLEPFTHSFDYIRFSKEKLDEMI